MQEQSRIRVTARQSGQNSGLTGCFRGLHNKQKDTVDAGDSAWLTLGDWRWFRLSPSNFYLPLLLFLFIAGGLRGHGAGEPETAVQLRMSPGRGIKFVH
jgi:hypothetical protein